MVKYTSSGNLALTKKICETKDIEQIKFHAARLKNLNQCAFCDTPNFDFRDELSSKEYKISSLCQNCQDETFGGPDEKSN